jgi:hypothetical protein
MTLCQIFRIFTNSAYKRQTTVTMNQILTQKWFLLQNTKDSSLNRKDVFNNGEWTYRAVGLFDRVSAKISKFKLKQVYATKNISMHPEHLKVQIGRYV